MTRVLSPLCSEPFLMAFSRTEGHTRWEANGTITAWFVRLKTASVAASTGQAGPGPSRRPERQNRREVDFSRANPRGLMVQSG